MNYGTFTGFVASKNKQEGGFNDCQVRRLLCSFRRFGRPKREAELCAVIDCKNLYIYPRMIWLWLIKISLIK